MSAILYVGKKLSKITTNKRKKKEKEKDRGKSVIVSFTQLHMCGGTSIAIFQCFINN